MKMKRKTVVVVALVAFGVVVLHFCWSLLYTGTPGTLAAPEGPFVSSDRVANEANDSGSFVVKGGEQVVFTTTQASPTSFAAWSFLWRLKGVGKGTDVDFEVYDGDGNLFYRNDHKLMLLPSEIRSDFKEGLFGLPSSAPLFGKPIMVVIKVKTGWLRTVNWGGYRFDFYKHAETSADWQRPFQSVRAVLSEKVGE